VDDSVLTIQIIFTGGTSAAHKQEYKTGSYLGVTKIGIFKLTQERRLVESILTDSKLERKV